jgi:hypothetical protein
MKFDYGHPVLMFHSGSLDSIIFPAAAGSAIYNQNYLKNSRFDEISSFMGYEIISSFAKKQFVVIPDYIITSARRYQQMGFGVYNTIFTFNS